MFSATCKQGYGSPANRHYCDVETDDPVLFVVHIRDVHKKRPLHRDSLAAAVDRGWRTPSHHEFNPGPFDVGAWVTWESKGRLHTGQVWALVPKQPRARWVADGLEFHTVYEDQLVVGRAAA